MGLSFEDRRDIALGTALLGAGVWASRAIFELIDWIFDVAKDVTAAISDVRRVNSVVDRVRGSVERSKAAIKSAFGMVDDYKISGHDLQDYAQFFEKAEPYIQKIIDELGDVEDTIQELDTELDASGVTDLTQPLRRLTLSIHSSRLRCRSVLNSSRSKFGKDEALDFAEAYDKIEEYAADAIEHLDVVISDFKSAGMALGRTEAELKELQKKKG